MKLDLKNSWVEKLTDGTYEQCYYVLKNNKNQFNVMGVLADISEQGNWTTLITLKFYAPNHKGDRSIPCYIFENGVFSADGPNFNTKLLNKGLLAILGVTMDHQDILLDMNDEEKPFTEIAQWIKENI